jgi:hypothetical protein
MNLGTPYDFRILPEQKKLTASPDPFRFNMDATREAQVQSAFQSNPEIMNPDSFLADTGTQAFLVIQNDAVTYERYFMGYQRDSIVTTFSVAKSFDMGVENTIHNLEGLPAGLLEKNLERLS